eukprot:994424_1
MAKRRDTGIVVSWNAYLGDGTIRRGTDTLVKCSKKDLNWGSIEIGDTVTFVTIKAISPDSCQNATDIRKSYSHNNNQNKPSRPKKPYVGKSSSRGGGHSDKKERDHGRGRNDKPSGNTIGGLFFQSELYTKEQLQHIENKYTVQNGPIMLFNDNETDKQRWGRVSNRSNFTAMAHVMGN